MSETEAAPHVRFRDLAGADVAATSPWFASATPEEHAVLRRLRPPVLDIGCGPGRHVSSLAARGVSAMGVDATRGMVRVARRRGARVHHGSVFDELPGGRCWASVLLLDGNIGIGGDPVVLLRRVAALLLPGGSALVEVGAPGRREPVRQVWLDVAGETSEPFSWATVAADDLPEIAWRAAMAVTELWCAAGRWFAELQPWPDRTSSPDA